VRVGREQEKWTRQPLERFAHHRDSVMTRSVSSVTSVLRCIHLTSFVSSSAVGVGWRPLEIFAGRWARPVDAVAPVTEPTAACNEMLGCFIWKQTGRVSILSLRGLCSPWVLLPAPGR
jgi:hypothetical protein